MTVGIERINIIGGLGYAPDSGESDTRAEKSRKRWPLANRLYRKVFADLEMPLLPGEVTVDCTKAQVKARYDWREGIDVLLYFESGSKTTLQEKFLYTSFHTATFEDKKDNGSPGQWYTCTAQYYFVSYDERPPIGFEEWRLLDLPELHRLDAQGKIPWGFRQNLKPGRRNWFRFVKFSAIPDSAVIASSAQLVEQLDL